MIYEIASVEIGNSNGVVFRPIQWLTNYVFCKSLKSNFWGHKIIYCDTEFLLLGHYIRKVMTWRARIKGVF